MGRRVGGHVNLLFHSLRKPLEQPDLTIPTITMSVRIIGQSLYGVYLALPSANIIEREKGKETKRKQVFGKHPRHSIPLNLSFPTFHLPQVTAILALAGVVLSPSPLPGPFTAAHSPIH